MVNLLAAWGVRFIKWDFGCCPAEAEAYRHAIQGSGFPIVLNLHGNQGGYGNGSRYGGRYSVSVGYADMFRASYGSFIH